MPADLAWPLGFVYTQPPHKPEAKRITFRFNLETQAPSTCMSSC